MDLGLERKSKIIRRLETAWWEGGPDLAPIMYFVHGYPDTPETWEPQLQYFSDRYHVVAPFARGANPSAPSRKLLRYGLHAQALDHLAVLRSVDPSQRRPVILVGHDLGAAQCWFLAPLLGTRLQAMVILSGLSVPQMAARLNNPRQHLRSWYIYAMLTPVAPRLLRHFSGQIVNMAHKLGRLAPPQRPRLGSTLAGAVDPAQQYRAYVAGLPQIVAEGDRKIDAPVLVIWGKDDSFLLSPSRSEIKRFANQATIRILKGNHWVHREDPETVNQLIDEFLTNPNATT